MQDGAPDDRNVQLLCPILSLRGRVAVSSLCRWPPNARPMRAHILALYADAEATISSFVNSTIVYVIAKQWADLLSIYVFRLHPRPFCTEDPPVCGREAQAWQMYLFASGLLLVLTPLQQAVARHEKRLPSLKKVQSASAQAVGWSLGAASVRLLIVVDNAGASLSACDSCNLLNTVASAAATLVTAAVIVVVEPAVLRLTMAKDGEERTACCSTLLHHAWQLLAAGLKYNVMILWTQVAKHALVWGVPSSEQSTRVFGRLLVAYAIALTSLCAIAVVAIIGWRSRIEAMPLPGGLPGGDGGGTDGGASAPATASDARQPRLRTNGGGGWGGGGGGGLGTDGAVDGDMDDTADAASTACQPTIEADSGGGEEEQAAAIAAAAAASVEDRKWLASALARLEGVLLRRATFVQLLVLMEATMGWVTGSAWTDAVVFWSPLGLQPT